MTRDEVAAALLPWVIGTLLLLPPLALLLFLVLRARVPQAFRPAVIGCAGLFSAVLLMAWAGFGLPSRAASCFAVLAAYGAFCFLVAASRLARPRLLGAAAGLVGWTMIGLGYVAGTLGFVGLGFILQDLAGPSEAVEDVAPGLVCETRGWGSSITASGYARHLYETWPLGIRRELASFSVQETEPADEGITCAEAYARYRAASGR